MSAVNPLEIAKRGSDEARDRKDSPAVLDRQGKAVTIDSGLVEATRAGTRS